MKSKTRNTFLIQRKPHIIALKGVPGSYLDVGHLTLQPDPGFLRQGQLLLVPLPGMLQRCNFSL